ncbi:MAG: UvrD-helicase domain-containing protein [Acidobacteria bacterium]|nr:UvrD-helicase domain-containing protein [Acidobacteriota bacterium]
MNTKAEIVQVQAAAGSGKTYELSRRYIEILTKLFRDKSGQMKENSRGCNIDATGGNGPESVLAITFTNKAAAEMKERILYFLKRIAFQDNPEKLPEFDFLDKDTAAALLTSILQDFSDFKVKTIDSFMNNVLKAFSVDAGLFPDFKLEFDADDVFSLSIETIFDTRPDLLPILKKMLEAVLPLDDTQSGFDPRRLTEKLLLKLKKFENEIDCNLLSNVEPYDAKPALDTLKKQAVNLINEMQKQGPKVFSGVRFKPDKQVPKIDRYGDFPKWMIDGRTLEDLKNKKAEAPTLEDLQEKLDGFRFDYRNYVISKAVEAFRAPVQVFKAYRELEQQFFKELNQFEINKMAPVIRKLLEEAGAPVAFCRLGEQYDHYLIDEFQDTSRNQWDAMVPLVENSLSKGGSLFFVGDTKQAIYGWRGGDYKLFHEVPEQKEIRLPVGNNFKTETLGTNYRSAKKVVGFNNALFSEDSMKSLADILNLPDLTHIYKNAEQKVADNAKGGAVRAHLFQSADKETRTAEIREWLRDIVNDAVSRFGPGNILILARVKEKVRTIAGWLVDLNIPFVTEDSLKLFGNPTVKSLLALLSAMVLPSPDNYLLGLVETGFFGKLDETESINLLRKYAAASRKDKGIRAKDFLRDNAPEFYKHWLAPLVGLRSAHSGYQLATCLVSFLQLEQGPDRSLIDRFLEEILNLEEDGIADTVDIVNHLYENMDKTSLSMPETKDVVRIMTIHKAKGLESPVVIIPFLDWKLVSNQSVIIGEAEPDSGKYLRITKSIADLDPKLAKIYNNARNRETIENINLMYVALTRAGQELHIGIPPASSGRPNSTVSGLFQQMMESADHKFDESGSFSIACPESENESASGEKKKDRETGKILKPKLRAASSLLSYADTRDEPFEFEARLRGTLLHKAMSFISHIGNEKWNNLEAIARIALKNAAASLGVTPDNTEEEDIAAISKTLLALKEWFSPDLPVWNEKEFVGSGGEMIRVDRLVEQESRFLVIDYKTGRPDQRYHRQLKRYMNILQPLGKPVDGILAYLDSGEVENVKP